jgi:hypothetical protein
MPEDDPAVAAATAYAHSRFRKVVMRLSTSALFAGVLALAVACSGSAAKTSPSPAASSATLARIYYWRARPGQEAAYDRYVRDVAEPIDHEALRRGAFLSVTTLVASDTTVPWTHMRVFMLRDSAQLAGLSTALNDAGIRLEPDSVKRRQRGEYSATLRDAVGSATLRVLR